VHAGFAIPDADDYLARMKFELYRRAFVYIALAAMGSAAAFAWHGYIRTIWFAVADLVQQTDDQTLGTEIGLAWMACGIALGGVIAAVLTKWSSDPQPG
jgi:hypothetical protein